MGASIAEVLERKCVEKCIPFNVQFELTYRCNLSCRHCYTVHEKGKELTFNQIAHILDQLVEMGTLYLCFTGGEIFARGDILDILWYAREKGFFLILLTNGTLITDKSIDQMQEIGLAGIEISLLGARAKTHDFITRTPGSFNRTVRAITKLTDCGIQVTTKTTLMKGNISEYQEIKLLARRLGVHPKIGAEILPKLDGGKGPQQYQVSWQERLRYLYPDLSAGCIMEGEDKRRGLTCKAGKTVASISPQGDVQPCILMPVKLGSLKQKSFQEIWYPEGNNGLNHLRSIKPSDLKVCFQCELVRFCTRCLGTAFLETRDLQAPSPVACEQAKWKAHCYKNYAVTPAGQG